MNQHPHPQALSSRIPAINYFDRIERIAKGYSKDAKYKVTLRDSTSLLLRIFPIEEIETKRSEFDMLATMTEAGVTCSNPIEFGALPDLELGYMAVSYIEGEDAQEVLPTLGEAEQYEIGFEAGKELRKMHRIEAPEEIGSWYERKSKKHQNYIAQYRQIGIRFRKDEEVLRFIDRNLGSMEGRPNRFQHDDYHPSNLIVRSGTFAGVIDFNRYDWGDPIHDFLKIGLFGREVSVPFSKGMIIGYHDGEEPEGSFWLLYSVYLAMSIVSSIVWIRKVKPEETDDMLAMIDRVLEDHDFFQWTTPKWYITD